MSAGFDELVEQLLYDVALAGERGIATEELDKAVAAFYDSQKRTEQPPTLNEDKFLDSVWEWLEKHPDVEIKTSSANSESAGQRVFTNQERIWRAATGHGVNQARVPPKEFELLSVIAAHGPEGVLQGRLRDITDQQKQSVPERTNRMAKKGYIVKEPALAKGCSTSLLKLWRFVGEAVHRELRVRAWPAGEDMTDDQIVRYDVWFDEIMRMLKENGGIIGLDDLRIGLGIYKNEWKTKALHRCTERFAGSGCVRTLSARVDDGASDSTAGENGTWIPCLQLLRDPTEQDRMSFTRTVPTERLVKRAKTGNSNVDSSEPEEFFGEGDGGSGAEDNQTAEGVEREPAEHVDSSQPTQGEKPEPTPKPTAVSSSTPRKKPGPMPKAKANPPPSAVSDTPTRVQPPRFKSKRTAGYVAESYEDYAKRMAQKLAQVEANKTSKKRSAEEAELPDTGSASKTARDDAAQSSPLQDTLEDEAVAASRAMSTRISEIESDLLSRTKPGAYINPPGAKSKRFDGDSDDDDALVEDHEEAVIAVIKSPKLMEFEWFKNNQPAQIPSKPSMRKSTGVRKSINYEPQLPKRKPGRPSKAEQAERRVMIQELQANAPPPTLGQDTAELNVTTPAVLSKQQPLPELGTSTNASDTTVEPPATQSSPAIDANQASVTSDLEEMQPPASAATPQTHDSSSTPATTEANQIIMNMPNPGSTPQTQPSTPVTLPKKRGRPTKAMVAERERLKREQGALGIDASVSKRPKGRPKAPKQSIVKLRVGAQRLQQEMERVSRAEWTDGIGAVSQSMVELPVPSAIEESGGHPSETTAAVEKLSSVLPKDRASITPGTISAAEKPPMSKSPSHVGNTRDLEDDPQGMEIRNQEDGARDLPADKAKEVTTFSTTGATNDQSRMSLGLSIVRPYFSVSSNGAATVQPAQNDEGVIIYEENQSSSEAVETSEAHATDEIDEDEIPDPMHGVDELKDAEYIPSRDDMRDTDYVPNDEMEDADFVPNFRAPRSGQGMDLQRIKIITEILRKAGGVFPGDGEVFHPFAAEWQKTYKQTPDGRTVTKLINNLVDRKRLNKFTFYVDDVSHDKVERHIIARPGVEESSSPVEELKKSIADSFPDIYLPPSAHISKPAQPRMRQVSALSNGGAKVDPKEGVAAFGKFKTYQLDRAYKPPGPRPHSKDDLSFENFPTLEGMTVKRTTQGIAVVNAEAQAKSRIRKVVQPIRPKASKIRKSNRRAGFGMEMAGFEDMSDDSDEDDDYSGDESIPDDQAAMRQHEKQLRALLLRPAQVFHTLSGTFGTPTPMKEKSTGGRPRKFQLEPGSQIDWVNMLAPPRDLKDLLGRANALGNPQTDDSYSRFYNFQLEVDKVSNVEQFLASHGQSLRVPESGEFINYGLNCPHVTAPKDFEFDELEFVEGRMRVGEAEKRSRDRKKRKLNTFGTANGPDLRSVAEALARSSNVNRFLSAHQSNVLDAQTVGIQSADEKRPYVYQTRFRGEGRPQLKDYSGAFTPEAVTESDDNNAPRTAATASKRRGKTGGGADQKRNRFHEPKRLAIALMLVKTLCSGAVERPTIKWEIVAHAMNFKYDVNTLMQRWKVQSRERKFGAEFNNRLQAAFYEPFLAAYEEGRLPKIDFANLEAIDWPALVRWVEKYVLPLDGDAQEPCGSPQIGDDGIDGEVQAKSTLDMDDTIKESGRTLPVLASLSIPSHTSAESKDEQKSVLEKSWIRAVTCTDDNKYKADDAAQKLSPINSTALNKIITEMIDRKTLAHVKKGQQRPGRNFRITHHVRSQFKRWPGNDDEPSFLRTVAAARNGIVEHFQEHDSYELGSNVTEPQLTVLNNMVVQGHLRTTPVLPERSEVFNAGSGTMSKWGLDGYMRSAKQADDSAFQFPIAYEKTSKFTTKHNLKPDVQVPMFPSAVLGEPGFRHPFWVDIHGNFIDHIWDSVLRSVLHVVVFKPGCSAKAIEKAHSGQLWDWEIDLVLKWMEEVGLAVKFGSGREEDGVWKGGWRAGEWWYCAFLPEVAVWEEAPNPAGETMS